MAARCRRAATDRADAVRSDPRRARREASSTRLRRERPRPRPQRLPAAALALAPGPLTLGLWADDPPEEPGARDLPEPALELEAGRTALVAGKFNDAVLHFGLALRLAPALAPAVLEATAGARASNLLIVRGDAYRLAGHEDEAREAYLAAARGGLPERRRRARTRPATTETGATEWTDGTDGTSRVEVAIEEGVTTTPDAAGPGGEADAHDASAETQGDAPG